MRAVVCRNTGGPEALELLEVPAPQAGAGEIVVDVEAAGLNFIDIYEREGIYAVETPFTAGSEGAGTVSAVGPGVLDVRVGDRVAWAQVRGAYAEQAVVPAARTVPVPDGVSSEQAAAVLLQGMTAQYLTASTYPLAAGDIALVHAAAGGTGALLTRMAALRGARVIATVSTDAKELVARAAGAAAVIRYTEVDDLAAAVRELAPDGVHVAYDGVGRTTFDASLASVRPRGMLVLFGASSGPVPPFDLQRLNRAGSVYVTRPSLTAYVATREELLERAGAVFALVRSGELEVRIDSTHDLADAGKAQELLASRGTIGKVLLRP